MILADENERFLMKVSECSSKYVAQEIASCSFTKVSSIARTQYPMCEPDKNRHKSDALVTFLSEFLRPELKVQCHETVYCIIYVMYKVEICFCTAQCSRYKILTRHQRRHVQ